MTETKTKRRRPWSVWLGIALAVAGLALVLFAMIPRAVDSLVPHVPEAVERVFVWQHPGVWEKTGDTSVDALSDAREELLDVMADTRVRWMGWSNDKLRIYRTDEHLYSLTLCGEVEGQYMEFDTIDLDESGNLYVGGSRYTGDTAALVDCVQEIWAAGESK